MQSKSSTLHACKMNLINYKRENLINSHNPPLNMQTHKINRLSSFMRAWSIIPIRPYELRSSYPFIHVALSYIRTGAHGTNTVFSFEFFPTDKKYSTARQLFDTVRPPTQGRAPQSRLGRYAAAAGRRMFDQLRPDCPYARLMWSE